VDFTNPAELAIGPQVFQIAQESMEKIEKRDNRYHLLLYTPTSYRQQIIMSM
jgi:hypothetical protein